MLPEYLTSSDHLGKDPGEMPGKHHDLRRLGRNILTCVHYEQYSNSQVYNERESSFANPDYLT